MNKPADGPIPLISVVTASFNAIEGLRDTVESVAGQTFRSFEHIVIDGGSGDGTREYLEALGGTVRWVSEPDDGIADALNKGVAMARGDYILVLQGGDRFVDRDSLSQAAEQLTEGPGLLAFSVILEELGGRRLMRSRDLAFRSLFHMPMPHQGLIASRDLFHHIGGFDTSYCIAMDYDWLLRARNAGAKTQIDARPLSVMLADGISSRRDWEGLSRRLTEFRRAQFAHSRGRVARTILRLYWALYPTYRRGMARLRGNAAG